MRRFLLASILSLAVPALVPAPASADRAAPPAPAKPAPAAAGPGIAAVRQANETIAAMLKQKAAPDSKEEKELAAKLRDRIRDFLDIDQLGQRAMADQWDKLSADQRRQFLTLLRELIEERYVSGLRANLSYSVDYTKETTDKDGNIVVETKISAQRKGRPFTIEVGYVLVKDGGKLRAWDVSTDGVGLVVNYRKQFNKIIEKEGFDGLIARMKKKQAGT